MLYLHTEDLSRGTTTAIFAHVQIYCQAGNYIQADATSILTIYVPGPAPNVAMIL